ncbi:lipopolysaccharide biosynthesis protein [Myroides marinus]|uniref:lipopolysaccharide biosynthesis protein n=1 Tax=Myroides marinus TaxID=703342 RepID=UPI0025762C25|nr:lipopolysaccharide biosynthesis protein [Myroides marinus]MDM1348443.1 lipopolysaccharide biosynthesis protein [Myroides marinus]
MSLRGQAIVGVIWTVADTFILRGLVFVTTLILARWVGPAEFGLVGILTVFIALGTSLSDSGLSASLIRASNRDSDDYTTVFWLNLGMSLVVYLILFLSTPFIAEFFKQEALVSLVRVYCLSFVISAISAIQLTRLTIDMSFKRIAKLNIPGTLIGAAVGIYVGYIGYGVWAVVVMYLMIQVIQSMCLWIFATWRPSFTFNKEKAKYHYGFGYKLMLSGLINVVFQYLYDIVIGRLYSVKTLGFYERSHTFNNYPVTIITSVVSKVTYPLLSSIQEDKERLGTVYRKILRITFFLVAPIMTLAAAVAKPLFLVVLGEAWLPAVPFFQILCLASMFYPIHAFNLNVFMVLGRSDLFLKLEVIKKIVVVIALGIGLLFGIYGMLWSSVVVSYIALLINTYYSADLIGYSQKQQFLDMLPSLLFALLSAGGVIIFDSYISFSSILLQIITEICLGGIVYLGLNMCIKSEPLFYSISIIKEKIK